ncbi:TIGR00303 family protein [Halovenus aranensis]|uniref:UPF0284 protein SAMN05216226_104136 n=1 Tax=Halovenus aranensis TaxID=890420 RepID=A0A1G8UA58_9EURY|nr:TIGR00303 family protein [Halovenus aranensis]SDJ50648.1 TIGR00303 family protein [Halovenus aranensis]
MTFVLVAGSTATATIDGISAAGANPDRTYHTPAADLELVTYGRPVFTDVVPMSPTGCPTPAVITRAVRDLLAFETVAIEAGLTVDTAAPIVQVGDQAGADIREAEAVPDARQIFDRARAVGRTFSNDAVSIGESVPGGTTTALGVLRALGEPYGVSSSLPENPLGRKGAVVDTALEASGIAAGEAAEDPLRAVRLVGDPVMPAVMGVAAGAIDTGVDVTLAGGTQMVAVAALLRHLGVDADLALATTVFVDEDTDDLREATDAFGLDLTVTDPGFETTDHVAMQQYCQGEAKEGVGMGGALALAAESDVSMRDVRGQIESVYGNLTDTGGAIDGA